MTLFSSRDSLGKKKEPKMKEIYEVLWPYEESTDCGQGNTDPGPRKKGQGNRLGGGTCSMVGFSKKSNSGYVLTVGPLIPRLEGFEECPAAKRGREKKRGGTFMARRILQ